MLLSFSIDDRISEVMGGLVRNDRFLILFFSGLLAFCYHLYVLVTFSSEQLQIIRLTQGYALFGVSTLYLVMLVGPLSHFFTSMLIQKWLSLRPVLLISTLFFALLHSVYAFFGQLGGFEGLPFLSNYYLGGITLSFFALLILTALISSIMWRVVKKITLSKWRFINILIYISGFLILLHALLLGTHFHDLSEFIPQILFIAVFFLLLIQAMSLEQKVSSSSLFIPQFGYLSVIVLLTMFIFYFWYINPQAGSDSSSPLSVHSQHVTSSSESQTSSSNKQGLYMPGMQGDTSKRFTVDLNYSEPVIPLKSLALNFEITDASNGDPVYFFQTPFEKPFHLIIVNSDLSYFSHIHPTQQRNAFTIETSFPEDDIYHLYSDFQPFGAIEQQNSFQLGVGDTNKSIQDESIVDYGLEKTTGDYIVRLSYKGPLLSNKISAGDQELKFSIFDKNNTPVTNLHPYLGAFGHLVMIKKGTFEYVHAHPVMTKPVLPNERSGPEVPFVPMAIYGKVTPGVYKVFGQFNPNGTVITADFWIEVI